MLGRYPDIDAQPVTAQAKYSVLSSLVYTLQRLLIKGVTV